MKTHDWKNAKRMLTVIGTTLSWAFTSLLFLIFFLASFHPSNQVLIDVNAYQEMGIESILFALIWIAITINLVMTLKGKKHSSNSKGTHQTWQGKNEPATLTSTQYLYNHSEKISAHSHNEAWYEAIKEILTGEESETTESEVANSRR